MSEERTAEKDADARNPKPCPKCGEVCKYDGWGHVHVNGLGIGSCVFPPAEKGQADA